MIIKTPPCKLRDSYGDEQYVATWEGNVGSLSICMKCKLQQTIGIFPSDLE